MKNWTREMKEYLVEHWPTGSIDELARHFDTTANSVNGCAYRLGLRRDKVEYALYRGDDLLAMGTVREISEAVGTPPEQIYYYAAPSYIKRTSENARRLIKLED